MNNANSTSQFTLHNLKEPRLSYSGTKDNRGFGFGRTAHVRYKALKCQTSEASRLTCFNTVIMQASLQDARSAHTERTCLPFKLIY